MPEDFRELRRLKQQAQNPPVQGVVVPENVYGPTLKDSETVKPEDGETVQPPTDIVVKTSFYPRQDQLDKLDDLAGEYNKKYRRQRKRIDRQDIIRFLIDGCTLDTLSDLTLF